MEDFTSETSLIKLKDRMEKNVRTCEHATNIFKILNDNNSDIDIVKNQSFSLIDISNLTPQTYTLLSQYLDTIELYNNNKFKKERDEKHHRNVYENSDSITGGKLKYTQSETHILNRINYENDVNNYQNEEQQYCDEKMNKKKNKK